MIRKRFYRQKKNGKVRMEKEGEINISNNQPSDPQPVAPVSKGVKQNLNIGLGSPVQIGTGGGNPYGGKLPPPPPIEKFPNPLKPKGLDDIKSPPPPPKPDFVDALQNQKELDIVTGEKKTIEQKLIQAQGLNLQNFVSFSVQYINLDSASETFIKKNYNTDYATIQTSGLQQHISFGDYYNILGIDVQLMELSANIADNGTNTISYLPSQLSGKTDPSLADPNIYYPISNPFSFVTNSDTASTPGITQVNAQSFGQIITTHFNQPNKWFGFSKDLSYTPRAYGLALESLRIHFQGPQNTSLAVVRASFYLAKDTAGQNL